MADGYKSEALGIAMILTGSGSRLCSGSMINNVEQDGKQYFLTADHCGILYSGFDFGRVPCAVCCVLCGFCSAVYAQRGRPCAKVRSLFSKLCVGDCQPCSRVPSVNLRPRSGCLAVSDPQFLFLFPFPFPSPAYHNHPRTTAYYHIAGL